MVKDKFYAVRVGKSPGVYKSWDECELQVKGFKGAKYKSFSTLEEAKEYIELSDKTKSVKKEKEETIDYEAIVSEHLKKDRLVAFTDGGYSGKNKICGYGIYILEPCGSQPIEISDIVRTDRFIKSNNIGPEVIAVTSALDWALSNGYDKITIFHDYEGIGKWARGEYKVKSDISKWFINKLDNEYNEILDIKYIWVPGHTGVKYNEEADRLATEAINKNIKPQFKMSETYFTCKNVCQKDVGEIIKKIKNSPDIDVHISDKQEGKTIYCLKGGKEKVTVTFHKKSNTTVVQGSPNSLFSLFLSYYTEKIPDFDLVIAYGRMRKQRIDIRDVNDMTNDLNLPEDFPIDAIKLIKQAISEKIVLEKKNKESIFDYGHYIFPACRALEGTIKYLFEKCGTHIAESTYVGSYFEFDDSNGRYFLKGTRYSGQPYKNHLENAYNTYYSNRHRLGHFGELLNDEINDSTTMMIETSELAIEIIDDILNTIKFD